MGVALWGVPAQPRVMRHQVMEQHMHEGDSDGARACKEAMRSPSESKHKQGVLKGSDWGHA